MQKHQSQETHKAIRTALPDTFTHFDTLPDAANVRLPTVELLAGCSRATVWRMIKDGRLPAPIRRGRITAWNVGELRQALAK